MIDRKVGQFSISDLPVKWVNFRLPLTVCLVPPLEKVSGAFLAPIYPARIAERNILHDLRKRHLTHLYSKVYVVRHQTERMDAMPESFQTFLQEKIESVAIFISKENVITSIPTQDDVVGSSGDMQSRFTCH